MQSRLLSLALFLFSLTPSTLACNTISGIKFTNYGFPDADGTPAYKCNGNTMVPTQAGDQTLLGDGSYSKPYAAAAATPSESFLTECELIYIPLLKKYFRVQDNCSGCINKQVDLYLVQSNQNIGQSSCEQAFGNFNYGQALHEVVRDPPSGYPTNTQPLFSGGTCYNQVSQGRIFESEDGQITCSANSGAAQAASAGSTGTTASSTATATSPAASAASVKAVAFKA